MSKFSPLIVTSLLLNILLLTLSQEVCAQAAPAATSTAAAESTPKGLQIVAACSQGFEDAMPNAGSIEYKQAEAEQFCHTRRLCLFKVALGLPCKKLLPREKFTEEDVTTYDLNKNNKVDCDDYRAWKLWLVDQSISQRSKLSLDTIEESLTVKECE